MISKPQSIDLQCNVGSSATRVLAGCRALVPQAWNVRHVYPWLGAAYLRCVWVHNSWGSLSSVWFRMANRSESNCELMAPLVSAQCIGLKG